MPGRRTFLRGVGALPLVGSAVSGAAKKKGGRDYLAELNVRPFINAAGTYTALTASLMPREVLDAMLSVADKYVNLVGLQEAVGKRIAELLECQAAMVTSGAAGALTVGTAACITGKDRSKIQRLPDTAGMKSDILVQKTHRYGYDHALRACGAKMLEIETAEEFSRVAAYGNVAVALFFNDADPRGKINAQGWVDLGKKHGIPTFNDAAADVPPVDNLKKYTRMGFDLVTFSGGKGLRGPQSAGLLLGRRDLIEAARMNTSPNSDTISRGMKVNKEEMVGTLAAVERYLRVDHDAERRQWDGWVETIRKAVLKVKSVESDVVVPEIANHVPHLRLKWDQAVVKVTPGEAMKKLREGTPSIECSPMTNKEWLVFGVWMMQPGDSEVVARKVAGLLKEAAA